MDQSTDVKALIDPELAAASAKAAEIGRALGPPGDSVEAQRAHAARGRAYWNEGGPEMAAVEEKTIPGPVRDIPVVLYRPVATEGRLPVFVYFHGGGFRFGNQWSNDRQMREIAAAWGGIVISSDYVHVPEYTFPTAVEEAAAVYRFLSGNGAAWGIDGSRIAYGGSSAGANVSTGAAVHLGGSRTGYLKAGVSIVGVLDRDLDTGSMRQFGNSELYPNRAGSEASIGGYVPDPAQRSDPRVDIGKADLSLLPPTFVAAAEVDTLRDASINIAERMRQAGQDVEAKIYPGMTHLFFGFSRDVARSREAVADVAAFLSRTVPAG